MKWMIYGAYGYSGELMARKAASMGHNPILAGRDNDKLLPLGKELNFETRCFALNEQGAAVRALEDVETVINCAGPFSKTFHSMAEICLRSKTNYLDITGEIEVFEAAAALSDQARRAGIILCPGAGFDVVPTDCVAAKLKELLPSAIRLSLGFSGMKSLSPGTAKTAIEGLVQGGKVREKGKIVSRPFGSKTRTIDFGRGPRLAAAIPWGDVSTAFYTTGIPNIQVYAPASKQKLKIFRAANYLKPLLKSKAARELFKSMASRLKGPGGEERDAQKSYVWGEAVDAAGAARTVRLQTLNGYELTSIAPILIAIELQTKKRPGGFYTPSKLMGADFINRVDPAARWEGL